MIAGQLDIEECIQIAEAEGRICSTCSTPEDCLGYEHCPDEEESDV